MRFSHKGANLDYEKAEAELLRAKELGVNYFDTAYIYPGSEELLGRFLEEHACREEVSVATKLPQYMVRKLATADRYFDEELRRLRTDYIDYYLMHMVTDVQQWRNLCALGIECISSTEMIANLIEEETLMGSVNVVSSLTHGNVVLTEVAVPHMEQHDNDEGVLVYDVDLPENSLIVAVSTKDDVEVAGEETRLYQGDTVVIASDRDKVAEVRSVIRGL
jgi:hypothetical protein